MAYEQSCSAISFILLAVKTFEQVSSSGIVIALSLVPPYDICTCGLISRAPPPFLLRVRHA